MSKRYTTSSMTQRIPLDVRTVTKRLSKLYPDADCTLDWTTPLELLVATILAAQCTDARVNIVTKSLFKKYRTPRDYLRVSPIELEQDIHSCGTFRMKAKAIQSSCQTIIDDFAGEVPKTMAEMLRLRGVGRKSAAVVLGTVFGVLEGIPIDTHNIRLLRRMGLTKQITQEKIEAEMMAATPRKEWLLLSHLLVAHGRAICTARNRRCELCPLQDCCPSSLTRRCPDLAEAGKKSAKSKGRRAN